MFKKAGVILGVVFITFFIAIAPSFAATIVNTGNPTDPTHWYFGAASNQWLAGEFTISQPYALTDIKTFCNWTSGSNIANIAIYSDGGDVPGSLLFNQSFTVGSTSAWQGLSGLNWNLTEGTYWVGFENRAGNFYGTMGGGSVLNPMQGEAYFNNYSGGQYVAGSHEYIPAIIEGIPTATPEPASLSLLGLGLLGLVFKRKKTR
jgi:hypothetical protein